MNYYLPDECEYFGDSHYFFENNTEIEEENKAIYEEPLIF